MSCHSQAGLVGRLACRAGGIGRLAAQSGFYAGLGLGVGTPAALVTRTVLQHRERARCHQFYRLAGRLQQAAALGYQALKPETPDRQRVALVNQAKQEVVAAAMSGMLKLPARYQGPLVHLAGDILLALDEQQLLKLGNLGWLAEARRTLWGSQSLFLLQSHPVGWAKPVAVGAAAGLTATGLGWVARRRRQDVAVNPYALTLPKFYRQFGTQFDMEAGLKLSTRFGGRDMAVTDLKRVLGTGCRIRPLVKQDGEDDIYLAEGPVGHIHYQAKENKTARLLAVVPRQNEVTKLAEQLALVTA